MIRVDGLNNESLVLDGEWLQKLRGGEAKTRVEAARYSQTEITEIDRKKGLFSREREQVVQATLTFGGGPFVGFTIPAEKRPELDALLAALEALRAAARNA